MKQNLSFTSLFPLGKAALLLVLALALFLALPTLKNNSVGASPPTWGLPYASGTTGLYTGVSGLHGCNFSAIDSYSFVNPSSNCSSAQNDASLDIGFNGSDSNGNGAAPAVALASGTVLDANASCNLVLIDHGNGWWAIYIHLVNLQVSTGQTISAGQALGTPNKNVTACGQSVYGNYPHVHFALLSGSGHSGTYQSLAGQVLCGKTVLSNAQAPGGPVGQNWVNNLQGLTSPFTAPPCVQWQLSASNWSLTNPVMVGTNFTAAFTVTNTGMSSFGLNQIEAHIQGPNGAAFYTTAQGVPNNNLNPGQSITYSQTMPYFADGCSNCYAGAYTATAAYLDPWGSMHDLNTPGSSVGFTVNGNVTMTSGINIPSSVITGTSASVSFTIENKDSSTFGYNALKVVFNGPNGATFDGPVQSVSNLPVGQSQTYNQTIANLASNCSTCYAGTYSVTAQYLDPWGAWHTIVGPGNPVSMSIMGQVVMTNGVNITNPLMTDTSTNLSFTIENKDDHTFGYNDLKVVFTSPNGTTFDGPTQAVANLAVGSYQTYSQSIANFADGCSTCYAGGYTATAEYLDPWGAWHVIVGPGNPVTFTVNGNVAMTNGVNMTNPSVLNGAASVSFTIENKDDHTFGYNSLKVVFNGPNGATFDGPVQPVSNLPVGQSQTYNQTISAFGAGCSTCTSGAYTATAEYLDPWGTWHIIVGPGNPANFTVN